jgi:hypothetical protein
MKSTGILLEALVTIQGLQVVFQWISSNFEACLLIDCDKGFK